MNPSLHTFTFSISTRIVWSSQTTCRLVITAILSVVLLLNSYDEVNSQLVINVDTTFNGTTLTVAPPNGLFVTDVSNNPLLTLTNGATTSGVEGLVVGLLTGESGQLLVENGSSITNSGSGSLGNFGSQEVLRGGAYLGLNAGSTGIATVTGSGSSWVNTGAIRIGRSGIGVLSITNGGFVSNTFGNVGTGAGSQGTVLVSGVGSSWVNTFELNVGFNGSGDVSITNSGTVSASSTRVGRTNGSLGILTIASGGQLSNTGLADLGEASGSQGTVTVTDINSTWSLASSLTVGRAGTGELTISNGGAVSNTAGDIGSLNGGVGAVDVDGSGSVWTVNGSLTIGNSGTGDLTIQNGGLVSTANSGRIGFNSGSNGTVNVTGAGSLWEIGDELNVGSGGTGSLTVSAGGQVVVGTDTFTGEGVFISTDGLLTLGVGGNIDTVNLVNNGSTTITGAGASWVINDTLRVGQANGSNGALNVENGGFLSNTAQAFIGAEVGSEGTVTVSGAGSQWVSGGNVSIGSEDGVGTLIVSGDSQVVIGNGNFAGNGIYVSLNSECFLGTQGEMVADLIVVDGALTGFGSATGDMDISGMISPGNSAGTLKVKGEITLTNTATVCIEIGGTVAGRGGFDVLDGSMTSNVDLGESSLELTLINGFVPDPNDEFVFLQNFSSINGIFGNAGDGFGDGQRINFAGGSFGIMYGTNSVILNDFQAIPEPAAIILATIAGLLSSSRRRRTHQRS